jgi:hypothetical protein
VAGSSFWDASFFSPVNNAMGIKTQYPKPNKIGANVKDIKPSTGGCAVHQYPIKMNTIPMPKKRMLRPE